MSRALLVIALVLAGVTNTETTSGDIAQVSIRVSPATSSAPANLFVQVWIERNPDNRWVLISVDSPDYFSSSLAELNGERSPRVRVVMFRDVPAGAYELRSEVFGSRGRMRASARTSARVLGR
jgi:hypothetical protein